MTSAALATLWGLTALGGSSYIQVPPAPDASSAVTAESTAVAGATATDEVPFVAQQPLLCGGAAAAMVERFWGRRGVYGDAYAHLVLEAEGGIRAADLRDAMEGRGFDTRAVTRNPEAVFDALEAGIPPILLLTGGEPALHYVVLVAADQDSVRIHDPNFGPSRPLSRRRLMERWAGSGFLALLATPGPDAAERGGQGAVPPAPRPPADPAVGAAMAALRAGDHAEARGRARNVLAAGGPEVPLARRILATSHYVDGEPLDALDHWNALSEPVIDLVEIRGARRIRHHVMASSLDLPAGSVLTSPGLRAARRRLAAVPAIASSRIDYAPQPDGTVEVRAFVTEEPRWPTPVSLVGAGVAAVVDGRVSVGLGPIFPAGDRWTFGAGWRRPQELVEGRFATAGEGLPGIVELSLDWRRERYPASPSTPATEERVRGAVRLDRWVSGSLRLGAAAAIERWSQGPPASGAASGSTRLGATSAAVRWAPADGVVVDVEGEGWWGSGTSYGRGDVALRLRSDVGPGSELGAVLGARGASGSAPRSVWPGAGTGEIREPLLRGHPLQVDGVVGGAGLGRRLLHATVEARRFRTFGPLQAGVALFLDAARVWPGGSPSPPRNLVDPGAGLFVTTGAREVRLDVARGEGAWVVSGRVRVPR